MKIKWMVSALLVVLGLSLEACIKNENTNTNTITGPSGGTDTTHKSNPVDTTTHSPGVTGVAFDSTVMNRPFGNGCQVAFQLSVHLLPASLPQNFIWSVTNHGAINVSATGLMTIIRAGTDTVYATAAADTSKKGRLIVNITNASCAPSNGGITITLVPDHGTGAKGSTGQVTAVVTAPPVVSTKVIWYSTNPSFVEVAQKDGDSINYFGQVILANVKGGTLWFANPGIAQICAQSVADPTIRACGQWSTIGSSASYIMKVPVDGPKAYEFKLIETPEIMRARLKIPQ